MNEVPSTLFRIQKLPEAVISLLHGVEKGGGDLFNETLDVLQRDERWLRQVSAFFPGCSLINEDTSAAVFQGRSVPEIAIATAVQRYIKIESVSAELSRYWDYSLACAVACAALSTCTGLNTALAFSCGLLHDLGRLALIRAFPRQYANLFAASQRLFGCRELFNVADQERLLFGFDRFQTGEWLVEQWGLPGFFKQIVGRFQLTSESADADLVALTRSGCSLVYAFGYGLMLGAPQRSIQEITSVLPASATDRYGSDLEQLKQIIDQTLGVWPSLDSAGSFAGPCDAHRPSVSFEAMRPLPIIITSNT